MDRLVIDNCIFIERAIMKIKKYVFDNLNRMISDEPPETGGILGSQDDDCITDVIMDKTKSNAAKICSYTPNVEFLNKSISKWADNGIYFMGVFHTHFVGVKSLSYADKKYIKRIMKSMPDGINCLYFPIFVLPEREMICYKAVRENVEIRIFNDELVVIN